MDLVPAAALTPTELLAVVEGHGKQSLNSDAYVVAGAAGSTPTYECAFSVGQIETCRCVLSFASDCRPTNQFQAWHLGNRWIFSLGCPDWSDIGSPKATFALAYSLQVYTLISLAYPDDLRDHISTILSRGPARHV
ncbi:hypothetical protein B0H13DRAFT_2316723 [Mycena leptocephala]|nr:hypothetical protein B0H13DRAFT_2316723 [Mycena leptocephala]